MAENTSKAIPKDHEATTKALDRYLADPPPLPEETQKLLVEYSGIPADQVKAHVRKIVSSPPIPTPYYILQLTLP